MHALHTDLLQGWNVVVVDDEDDSLLLAELMLTEYGAAVYTAVDGKEGLDLILRVRPKFVLSDLSMPVLDGWGLISAMQDDVALKNIPVIALTAHAMMGDRERAVAAGFHNYLTKPLTVDTFMKDLVKLLVDVPELASALRF